MVSTYVLDASGNPGTLNNFATDYNRAGLNFPVGPGGTLGQNYLDPWYSMWSSSGSSINHFVLTIGGLRANTGVPAYIPATVGQQQILWNTNSPAVVGDSPKIIACLSGCTTLPNGVVYGANGSTFQLDKDEGTSQAAGTVSGSVAKGCLAYDLIANTALFSTSSVSQILCSFGGVATSSVTAAGFDHTDFGPTAIHTSTTLRISSTSSRPVFSLTNNHYALDSFSDASSVSFVGIQVNLNVNLTFTDNDCDGGNTAVAPGDFGSANFIFPHQTSCINWSGTGAAGGIANGATIIFSRNYIHGWAGNPIQINMAYNAITAQANVFEKNGMNNGSTGEGTCGGPVCTGLHGAAINFNTSNLGAENYYLHEWNNTYLYPFNFRAAVTTASMAILCGVGSALTLDDVDFKLQNDFVNRSVNGHATMSNQLDAFRCGYVKSITGNHNYWNNVGAASCIDLGTDLQASGGGSFVVAANAGAGTSILTTSSLVGPTTGTLPFQLQTIVRTTNGQGSSATRFTASQVASGANSNLTITGTPPSTLVAGSEVYAYFLSDPTAHPTTVVSGSGSSYVVTNGSGSGETVGSESYVANVHTLHTCGSGGTTAVCGTSIGGYNGTWLVDGEETDSAGAANWAGLAIGIGNLADVKAGTAMFDNHDIQSVGSAGDIVYQVSCPNTGPP